MEQEKSSPDEANISSPPSFPLPWQPELTPSPGESQLWQVWVVMWNLPIVSGILLLVRATVKLMWSAQSCREWEVRQKIISRMGGAQSFVGLQELKSLCDNM